MIKTLVPDNTKAIIKDADALNPTLVAAFLDYVQARAIFVGPARVRSTDVADYPIGKAAYAMRSVDSVQVKAKEKGVHIGAVVERLLGGPLPWTRMRQAYALLRLCDKYGDGRVTAVCQNALAFDVVDVTRLARMLEAAAIPAVAAPGKREGKLVQLTLPRFARPEQHFETRTSSQQKEEEGQS